MKIAVLFSGGKDSVYTISYFLNQGWDVKCLLTVKSKNLESYMFHTPNIDVTELQAEALGIPLIQQETDGHKETELDDLRDLLKKAKNLGATGIAVGAIASDYQQERINRISYELGMNCFAPLWHTNQAQLLKEMIEEGFKIYFSSIGAYGLDASFLGKHLEMADFSKLCKLQDKFGLHVAGEGGEFESIVLDGPIFKKKIVVKQASVKKIDEYSAQWIIRQAVLVAKS